MPEKKKKTQSLVRFQRRLREDHFQPLIENTSNNRFRSYFLYIGRVLVRLEESQDVKKNPLQMSVIRETRRVCLGEMNDTEEIELVMRPRSSIPYQVRTTERHL